MRTTLSLAGIAVILAAAVWWVLRPADSADGIASGYGRIEATQIDLPA